MKKTNLYLLSIFFMNSICIANAAKIECSYDKVLKPLLISDSGDKSVGDEKARPCDQPAPLCAAHLMCGKPESEPKKRIQVIALCPAINNECPNDASECYQKSVIIPSKKSFESKLESIR